MGEAVREMARSEGAENLDNMAEVRCEDVAWKGVEDVRRDEAGCFAMGW